jgi:CRP-like cAMP-binding protein
VAPREASADAIASPAAAADVAPDPPAVAPDAATCLRALSAVAPLDDASAMAPVLAAMRVRALAPGESWLRVGDPADQECLLVQGLLRSSVGDHQGREVTLCFHQGPAALTPAVARVDAQGRSRIDCQALAPSWVATFPSELLVRCMVQSPAVQRWGDAVLRAELLRRADREWSLAAQSAAERLARFRADHSGLESRIPQHLVASYLGITAVSLSRLRGQARRQEAR